jgi:hypothetical protein
MENRHGDLEMVFIPHNDGQEDDDKTRLESSLPALYEQEDYIAAQGQVYSAGMVVFMLGFIVFGLRFMDDTSFLLFLSGLLQTAGGTFTLATADLDILAFLKERKWHAIIFATLSIFGTICAWAGNSPATGYSNVINLLPSLPFVYMILRLTPVLSNEPGYPTFADLLALFLCSVPLSFGLWTLLGGLPGSFLFRAVLGGANLLCSIVTAVFYRWCRQQGNSPSEVSQLVTLVFLSELGFLLLLNQTLDTTLNHQSAADNPSFLSPLAWCFGPMHIVFPPLMLWLRPSVLGMVGRQWLLGRLQEPVEFSLLHIMEKERGGIREVRDAILAGADLNQCNPATSAVDAYPLLVFAAANGHIDSVRALLEAGCDVNATSRKKQRGAVYTAAESGNVEILRKLLEAGGESNCKDLNGCSPLYIASLMGHHECVVALVAHGGTASEDILLVAAANGHRAIVDVLLSAAMAGGEVTRSHLLRQQSKRHRHMSIEDAYALFHQRRRHRQQCQEALWTFGFSCFLGGYLIAAAGWVFLGNPAGNGTKEKLDPGDFTDILYPILQTAGSLHSRSLTSPTLDRSHCALMYTYCTPSVPSQEC